MSHPIQVIGLGSGDINQLPLGIYKQLKHTQQLTYVRTLNHPVIQTLMEEGIQFTSFDQLYDQYEKFEQVYDEIVEILLSQAKQSPILYAVPGHPMLAEKTVDRLLKQTDIPVEIIGGHSYLDALFTTLRIDPIEGFQLIDATSFDRVQLNYENHLIFCQVYDQIVASQVKLTLLEDLPPEYNVKIVKAAGSSEEKIETKPLKFLDHSIKTHNLMTIYVPPVPKQMLNHTFHRLREVIAILRGPSGCKWDRAQTHESLRPYVIEEAYELIEAIDAEDDEGIIEELGDVLLQVMLHSQIGEDANYFTIEDVIQTLTNKMIHRHPHVFNNERNKHKSRDELKRDEQKKKQTSILEGIPRDLPPLKTAVKLQQRAAKVGFDWDDISDVWQKLDEELAEFQAAVKLGDKRRMEDELGDVLFVMANVARFYNIYPELALHQGNQKFIRRFQFIENELKQRGKNINDVSLEEMDKLWEKAKEKE